MIIGKLSEFSIGDEIRFISNIDGSVLRVVGLDENGRIGCQYKINPDCTVWHSADHLAYRALKIE